uniref:Bm9829 n=1 Tax=Brugia malayi TaxID=6279 RepID=A0A1I9G2C5_BRUMA|nr:Bm9829 [Brugia malayi]
MKSRHTAVFDPCLAILHTCIMHFLTRYKQQGTVVRQERIKRGGTQRTREWNGTEQRKEGA